MQAFLENFFDLFILLKIKFTILKIKFTISYFLNLIIFSKKLRNRFHLSISEQFFLNYLLFLPITSTVFGFS